MGIVSLAIIKLSLISLLGFFLYKRKILGEESLRFLTFFIINFSVPFLIFSHLIQKSDIVIGHHLWIFIAISVGIFVLGYFLGVGFSFAAKKDIRKEFISTVSFQNSGYLPMNIAFFLFPQTLRQEFLVYIFLYLLGFNVIMWSVGSYLIFRKKDERFKVKTIFTPPIVGTLFALLFIYTRTAVFVPEVLLSPLKLIGDSSFVLSALVLGCWLAKIDLKNISKGLFVLGIVSFLKLLVIPFLFFMILAKFNVFSILGLFIILEASMPSAVSLPIVANLRHADSEFVSQGVFFTHILSIITIPLWVGLYLKIAGLSF